MLPSVYMFNIFQGLGGFYMSDYINAPQNHPLYPIYFDYIQPLDGTLPYLGVGLYFAILSFWVFSHRK